MIVAFFVAKQFFWLMVALLSVIAAIAAGIVIYSIFASWDADRSQTPSGADSSEPISEKAIGLINIPTIPDYASAKLKEENMRYDKRLVLVDADGEDRFAAIIKGSFQVGKARESQPTDIVDFARAILIEGKGGRFVCADGRKPGVLKFGVRESSMFRLDAEVAAKLRLPTVGHA